MNAAQRYSVEDILKGKMPLVIESVKATPRIPTTLAWTPPPVGKVALSADGAFSESDGTMASGMILRHNDGTVVFAAYRYLFNCNDALEAEIHAMIQGMALALQHTELPFVVQSDSSTALSIFKDESLLRSPYGHLAMEINALREGREFIPQKLHCTQNRVADCLARYIRTECSTVVWLHRGPRVLRISCLSIVTISFWNKTLPPQKKKQVRNK